MADPAPTADPFRNLGGEHPFTTAGVAWTHAIPSAGGGFVHWDGHTFNSAASASEAEGIVVDHEQSPIGVVGGLVIEPPAAAPPPGPEVPAVVPALTPAPPTEAIAAPATPSAPSPPELVASPAPPLVDPAVAKRAADLADAKAREAADAAAVAALEASVPPIG